MSKFLGALIRRERLKQNFSQEGLCRGICAVSWLSKIEQGKAKAADDILLPLLKRLGIEYETDPAFLAQADALIETLYENLYAGMGWTQDPGEARTGDPLRGLRERLLTSPYMLDALLLECALDDAPPPPELRDFVPCMNRRQYEVYLMLRMGEGSETAADELLRLNPCGFYTCQVGVQLYRQGRYLEAMELMNRAYDLAARDGYVYLMCQAKIYLGNCCSDGGQLERMLDHYRVARRLAAVLQDTEDWLRDIDYNVGSTLLEWGRAEEALAILQGLQRQDALYYHKLAIALEKLGRREEALEAVELARTGEVYIPAKGVMKDMLDLVEYRLRHPDYLQDKAYSALMENTFALVRRTLPSGFVRFHLPYMLEALEAERRYKEAYRLSAEIFQHADI